MECREPINQVNVNMVKLGVRYTELANWRHGMDANFRALANYACAGPLSNVLIHVEPNVLQCIQALSGTVCLNGETMELVEDLFVEV